MKTLETERLFLRKWQESDAENYLKIYSDPDVENAGARILKTINESELIVKSLIKVQESWAIVLKETNEVIGSIHLNDINRHNRYKEMEYVISKENQNNGYATESVKCILKYAFTETSLLVVAVCHYPYNMKSKRVIEKCGFTYEGTLRKYSRNLADSVRYSMTKEEWDQQFE